ncbi:MAG: sigma-70 family RNA polymerase sigma factor [Deltaproteobacteria bacterium]|nr:sigma-70 family RNA polymerase sigma factor [Nannocystaceae bacterium]
MAVSPRISLADEPSRSRELDDITIARAQRGDAEACRAFVRWYEAAVFALLGRMLAPRGLDGLVEDLAQESFLRVFRALPRFDRSGPARMSTWILCIASRLAINELERRRPALHPMPDELVDPGAGESELHRPDLRRALRHAIAALTPEQQAVFVLREYHGLTEMEIAAALELDASAVKSRLFRARARLRAALTEVERG